jgi:hypothetical protein
MDRGESMVRCGKAGRFAPSSPRIGLNEAVLVGQKRRPSPEMWTPAKERDERQASRSGGKSRPRAAPPPPLMSVQEAVPLLRITARRTLAGRLSLV